jgi:hypothetical protein
VRPASYLFSLCDKRGLFEMGIRLGGELAISHQWLSFSQPRSLVEPVGMVTSRIALINLVRFT